MKKSNPLSFMTECAAFGLALPFAHLGTNSAPVDTRVLYAHRRQTAGKTINFVWFIAHANIVSQPHHHFVIAASFKYVFAAVARGMIACPPKPEVSISNSWDVPHYPLVRKLIGAAAITNCQQWEKYEQIIQISLKSCSSVWEWLIERTLPI